MSSKKSDTTTVKWHGTAGIELSRMLRDGLLEALKRSEHVLLDISEVDDIDITGIQLILAAKKESEAQGKTFYITGIIPDVVSEFISACNISLDAFTLTLDSKTKIEEK